MVLHRQLDGLFFAIEERAVCRQSFGAGGGRSHYAPGTDDGCEFKIAVVGDSTMRASTFQVVGGLVDVEEIGSMSLVGGLDGFSGYW